MSNINQALATQLAQKNANEMELQHVRELVAENIFNNLIQQSTNELVKQATEAGIVVDQQVILDTAIEKLKIISASIWKEVGSLGRCSDSQYRYWYQNLDQIIDLLS